jgi:hypothetical protein
MSSNSSIFYLYIGKEKKMNTEETTQQSEEKTEVTEEVATPPEVAVTQPEVPVPSVPTPVPTEPVQKKKRKRSEAQVRALQNARQKKAKKANKPVKIERVFSEESTESEFSWTKECKKVFFLGTLGLASVFVQQRYAQSTEPVTAAAAAETSTEAVVPPPAKNESGKDPFHGFR